MKRPRYDRSAFAWYVRRQPHRGRLIVLNQTRAAARLEMSRSTVRAMVNDLEADGTLRVRKDRRRLGLLVQIDDARLVRR